jgi:hypothetical protein
LFKPSELEPCGIPELYLARDGHGPWEGRCSFRGREALKDVIAIYCQKRGPERKKGEANPI